MELSFDAHNIKAWYRYPKMGFTTICPKQVIITTNEKIKITEVVVLQRPLSVALLQTTTDGSTRARGGLGSVGVHKYWLKHHL